jgi:outer membrane receptor protein involved in Fe transport
LNDLYFHDGFGNDGNAGLKPENAEEYEGGIEQPLGRGSAIKFTAFKRRVRDLILWLPNPASPFYPFAYTPINTDGIVRITGTETELRFVLSRMLSGTLNYTRIFPVKLDTGERLFSAATNIPAMKFGGTLNLALDARTALSLDGQRVKNYVGPGEEKWDYYTVDGRVTDAIVSRKDLKMDVFVGMKNMFNRKYEVVKDYPMPPTQLYGGVTAQF